MNSQNIMQIILIAILLLCGYFYLFQAVAKRTANRAALPVIAILASVIRGLSRNHSLEVRGNALLILTCSLTIGYFASVETLTWLSFYLYLLYSDQEYAKAVEWRRNEIKKKLMRRYRSLSS